jgi:hypothetical protein
MQPWEESMKTFTVLPMVLGLMLALSVPAVAEPIGPALPPDCPKGGCTGPGPGGIGGVVSDNGVNVFTTRGTVTVDRTDTPPNVTNSIIPDDCLGFICEEDLP